MGWAPGLEIAKPLSVEAYSIAFAGSRSCGCSPVAENVLVESDRQTGCRADHVPSALTMPSAIASLSRRNTTRLISTTYSTCATRGVTSPTSLTSRTPRALRLARRSEPAEIESSELPQGFQAEAARHHGVAPEMGGEEPVEAGIAGDLKGSGHPAFAVRSAGLQDGLDAVEHGKRGKRQLRPAEQVIVSGGKQIRQAVVGAALGHCLRGSFRTVIARTTGSAGARAIACQAGGSGDEADGLVKRHKRTVRAIPASRSAGAAIASARRWSPLKTSVATPKTTPIMTIMTAVALPSLKIEPARSCASSARDWLPILNPYRAPSHVFPTTGSGRCCATIPALRMSAASRSVRASAVSALPYGMKREAG